MPVRQATLGWLLLLCHHIDMTSALTLQFTSVRTSVVDGKTLIGLRHTAKDAEGARVSTDWVEMPPEDVERLVKTLQDTLTELASK